MTGWIAFAAMSLIAVALALALKRKADADLASLREAQREELSAAVSSARERVNRLEREAERSQAMLRDDVVKDILPAIDSLEVARAAEEDPEVGKGLDLVLREFRRALGRHGIEPIEPARGEAFDPALHEAVETFEDAEIPAGAVGRCHRSGWTSGGKALRAALVGVVRAPVVELAEESAVESEVVQQALD